MTWTGKDADKDTLQYQLEISQDHGKTWESLNEKPLKTLSYDWDTAKYSDGIYQLRITVDDALSNAEEARKSIASSLPLTLDNTPPTVEARLVKTGKEWRLAASASDATSPISGAEWRFVAKEKEEVDKIGPNLPPTIAAEKEENTQTAVSPPAPAAGSPTSSTATATTTTTTAIVTAKKTQDELWYAINAADGIFDSRREVLSALISSRLLPQPAADSETDNPDSEESEEAAVASEESTSVSADASAQTEVIEYQIELRVYDAAGNSVTVTLDLP